MSQISIPSLSNKDESLFIEHTNSSDIGFGTMDKMGICDIAFARTGMNSIYSSVPNTRHLQIILGSMINNFPQTSFGHGALVDFSDNKKMEVASFSSDRPDVYVSVIRTKEELIGMQTWHKDWDQFRENTPVIWLGYADESCESAKTLRRFYQEAHYNILPAWKGSNRPAKWAERKMLTLDEIEHPVFKIKV